MCIKKIAIKRQKMGNMFNVAFIKVVFMITANEILNYCIFSLAFISSLQKGNSLKAIYNPGHNTLKLYNILVQIRFTTSNMKLDIYYSKLGIRVSSRVAERLKTYDPRKLGNIRKISNLGRHIV